MHLARTHTHMRTRSLGRGTKGTGRAPGGWFRVHIARRVRAPKGAACKGAPAPEGCRMHIARGVRAPKGAAACKGAPTPEGCRSCTAHRVRVPKGAACGGAPAPLGRQFQIARRVRAIALVLP